MQAFSVSGGGFEGLYGRSGDTIIIAVVVPRWGPLV